MRNPLRIRITLSPLLAFATAVVISAACTGLTTDRSDGGPDADPLQARSAAANADPAKADPAKREAPLPASAGWNGFLIFDNGATGIWTVKPFPVFPQYGSPEVVGLTDDGRCKVMVSYSGKWTPNDVIHDGKWLGGLSQADVDPRIEGSEIYTGGQKGNLYQVVAYPNGALDSRLIAAIPGHEIHTVLAGDLDPRTDGAEVLVFTRPGALYRATPTGPDGRFQTERLETLRGRVRDALVLTSSDAATEIATVSRTGRLEILRITRNGHEWTLAYQAEMGLGRIARRQSTPGEPIVLYSTHDDGRVLRHEQTSTGAWHTETIFLGAQGPRGLAPGRFTDDPAAESVAVFGYSAKVQLLTRGSDGWSVTTIFEDRDKGHWLSPAELDGRNATDELIGSGYGGRIFMLTRPTGYGVDDIATDARTP